MTPPQTFELLAIAIASAGLLGGLINFHLSQRADGEDPSLWKSATLGIGAASLVPLFLNTISSNLVQQIQKPDDPSKIVQSFLVFFGFCLVASISSKAFIQS